MNIVTIIVNTTPGMYLVLGINTEKIYEKKQQSVQQQATLDIWHHDGRSITRHTTAMSRDKKTAQASTMR